MLPSFQQILSCLGLTEYRCLLCHAPFDPCTADRQPTALLCPACLASLSLSGQPRCPHCALPLPVAMPVCGECLASVPPWSAIACYGLYSKAMREMILALKFHGRFALAAAVADLLVETVACLPLPDLLVPIPLHIQRLRQRGYNQVQECSRFLAARLGVPVSGSALIRTRNNRPQSSLEAGERRRNLRHSFMAGAEVAGNHCWLLDDVLTTGSTLRAATHALLEAGACRVDVVVLARTPFHHLAE